MGVEPAGRKARRLDSVPWREPLSVHVDHPLAEAAARLKDADTDVLIVLDGDEIVGTLSAHDMLAETMRKEERPRNLRVQDVMDHRVPYCHAHDAVTKAVRQLIDSQARILIILDDQGQAAGIVTTGDLAVTPEGGVFSEQLARAADKAQAAAPVKTDPTGGRRRQKAPGEVPSYSEKPHLAKNKRRPPSDVQ